MPLVRSNGVVFIIYSGKLDCLVRGRGRRVGGGRLWTELAAVGLRMEPAWNRKEEN